MKKMIFNTLVVAGILLAAAWISSPRQLDASAAALSVRVGGCSGKDHCADWSEQCPTDCRSTKAGHCKTETGKNATCNKPSTCGEEGWPEKCKYPHFCTPKGDLCTGSPEPPPEAK